MNVQPLFRRGWKANHDESEFKRTLDLLPDRALRRLEQIVEEHERSGDELDLIAVCRTLYALEWQRLRAELPEIPVEVEPFIDDNYWFAAWGPDDAGHAIALRNDAIQRARRRKELEEAMPPKRGTGRIAFRSGVATKAMPKRRHSAPAADSSEGCNDERA